MRILALANEQNQCSFRHLSRNLPLKDSMARYVTG